MGLLTPGERNQLYSKLMQVPGILAAWPIVRMNLLSGLDPSVYGHIPYTGIANVDLLALINTVEQPGLELDPAKHGYRWALLPIIENALTATNNLKSERDIRELYILALARVDVRRAEGVELEALLSQRTGFQSVQAWAENLFQVIRPICRVDVNGKANGTGFLVGPNLVLTNYHVTHNRDSNGNWTPIPLGQLSVRFDYHPKDNVDNPTGVPYQIQNETLPKSPFANLDFALLRVTGSPADDPVGGIVGNPKRSFLSPQDLQLAPGDPLFIIQHAQGRTMEIAFDLVSAVQATRVLYKTNTEPGSSGSPCFDKAWNLVALHHAANSNINPSANQAIPLGLIMAHPEVQPLLR